MIIQLKKDSTEEFVFCEESSLNFPCYTELIKVLSELLDKLPPYFKDLYYIMRRCVDLLFFKQNKDLVEFSETKPKEYFTVFDEDIA